MDRAFADNASDSVCVDAGTTVIDGSSVNYVSVVVMYGDVTVIPEHRPDVTPGGKLTIKKRTKSDRNALYARAIASTVLVTAKEALAVAPGATEVRVMVVRPAAVRSGVEPIFAGAYSRALLDSVDWSRNDDPFVVAFDGSDVRYSTKGSAHEVVAFPVPTGSSMAGLLDALDRAIASAGGE
ncbi:MAG: hypothetical protein U0Q21_15410 [Dermatophilaceae bacterium]